MSWKAPWRPSLGSAEHRGDWRHFLKLASAYFVSSEWKVAWAMLMTLLGHRVGAVYLSVLLARWNKLLFDTLGAMQSGPIPGLVLEFLTIISILIAVDMIAAYMQPMLAMRWRAWLTYDYQERWLRHDRYLDIERTDTLDNPDQRIAEDLWLFTSQLLGLGLNLLTAVSAIWMFGGLLLEASDAIRFDAFGQAIAIPGDMVIYAVLYALVGSWLITKIGRPFVRRTQRQQKREADYRFRLINVRRNAEQIAFARAGSSEWRMLVADFGALFANFRKTQIASIYISSFNGVYGYGQTLLPILLSLPKYFARRVTIGGIIQTQQGFGSFAGSLAWFVQNYQVIGTIAASVNRIRALDSAIDAPSSRGIATVDRSLGGVVAQDLVLSRPDGNALAGIGDWTIARGERWCIGGPSGVGKSTLLRALAGIWPYGEGRIELPSEGLVMFLPQRGYLPIGTIKEALAFPCAPEAYDDDRCVAILRQFGLDQWATALHEHARWSERLSPGEQQRMALARVILQRPDYVFLDEATSALDPENATHAFETLLAELPSLTLVSVVHDPALERFHTRKLVIEQGIARQCACAPA